MKQLQERFPKTDIANLPTVAFGGRIIVVHTAEEAERAVDYLLKQPILGFDTETRPTFSKGHRHKVALLQVSTADKAFLFRLCEMGLPKCLLRLLTDRRVTKVGLSWHDDVRSLQARATFECAPFVELQDMAKRLGIGDMSLQKLCANVLGVRISKRQQLSNWAARELTSPQKLYAATDAWACVRLYEEMRGLEQTGDYQLIPYEEPQTAQG